MPGFSAEVTVDVLPPRLIDDDLEAVAKAMSDARSAAVS